MDAGGVEAHLLSELRAILIVRITLIDLLREDMLRIIQLQHDHRKALRGRCWSKAGVCHISFGSFRGHNFHQSPGNFVNC